MPAGPPPAMQQRTVLDAVATAARCYTTQAWRTEHAANTRILG